MKKLITVSLICCLILLVNVYNIHAQKWYTRAGKIGFYSSAPLEKIEAVNKTVTAVLETKTGMMQFSVLMRGFEFHKALMQEHFNENYVESDKYPKATFSGLVIDNSKVHYGTNGTYPAEVEGMLMIHGVTQSIKASGTIIVKDNGIQLVSEMLIAVADYDIKIPSVVANNIAKEVKVTVDCYLGSQLN